MSPHCLPQALCSSARGRLPFRCYLRPSLTGTLRSSYNLSIPYTPEHMKLPRVCASARSICAAPEEERCEHLTLCLPVLGTHSEIISFRKHREQPRLSEFLLCSQSISPFKLFLLYKSCFYAGLSSLVGAHSLQNRNRETGRLCISSCFLGFERHHLLGVRLLNTLLDGGFSGLDRTDVNCILAKGQTNTIKHILTIVVIATKGRTKPQRHVCFCPIATS